MAGGRRLLILPPPHPTGWQPAVAAAAAVVARRRGWATELATIGLDGIAFRPDAAVAGIIVAIHSVEVARALAALGLPMVNTDGAIGDLPHPRVGVDPVEVARLACRHFRSLGCPAVAVAGVPTRWSSRHLIAAFVAEAEAAGLPCRSLALPGMWRASALGVHAPRNHDAQVRGFLAGLPAGCGLLVWGDHHARIVADLLGEAALAGGLVRLLASNDDPLLLGGSPAISAVHADPFAVATRAVDLLLRQIAGEVLTGLVDLVAPTGVEVRMSGGGPTAGSLLDRALTALRADLDRPLTVAALAGRLGVQRRTLERTVRRALGCSPLAVRQQARVARAQAMLAQGATLAEAAAACGYARPQALRRLITAHTTNGG